MPADRTAAPAAETSEDQVRVRMSAEFKGWLEDLGDELHLTMADTVTQGLVLLARDRGFRPPPRRSPKR